MDIHQAVSDSIQYTVYTVCWRNIFWGQDKDKGDTVLINKGWTPWPHRWEVAVPLTESFLLIERKFKHASKLY